MNIVANDWNSLDIIPPDCLVKVIDAEGNMAEAYPTYYPFEVVKMPGDEKKQWGWRGTPVFFEDGKSHWDGGWIIVEKKLQIPNIGNIIGWQLIN